MTKIFAAYNKNNWERFSSSSGGVFVLLAKSVLSQGGSVWGAAYDELFHVKHIEVTDHNSLHKLLGSKYVLSKLDKGAFLTIKKRLQEGQKVLFCGTPCQAESVIRFVGPELRKRLLVIDFTCHGTPLPEVWEAYLKCLEEKGDLLSVNMRHKKFGWKTYSFVANYKDGKKFTEIFTWNHYSQAFLFNYSLRKPCYSCIFRDIVPHSDITLGDYWNIAKKHPEMNDDKGISKLYVHTELGESFLHSISHSMEIVLDEEIQGYKTMAMTIRIPHKRDLFLNVLENEGFEAAYRKAIYGGFVWALKIRIKGLLKIILHYKYKF